MRLLLFLLIFLFFIQVSSAHVMVVELKNTITPASDDIIAEALEKAKRENAQALIITLNTPGGGLEETKRIIQLIEASEIPVIGYVYPRSATAWSAGTLILLSTDIAAMAPNTIIGSVQPVEMTSEGMKPVEEESCCSAGCSCNDFFDHSSCNGSRNGGRTTNTACVGGRTICSSETTRLVARSTTWKIHW